MSLVILNHRVKDFKSWKPYYDADIARRQAAGLREVHLGTNASDPNDVFVILETADVEKAMKMMDDPSLHDTMEKAGVLSRPTITVLNKA